MKLWKLDFKKDTLTMKHTKTLQLKEAVLSVEFTKDGKFIAVALMDSTVKVFYRDTLKFWNSLYGHHLPVNCLAASDDSTLMVTGSADRAVKLWGMDFADCHKSFIAHDKGGEFKVTILNTKSNLRKINFQNFFGSIAR